ncbi:MAG: hypothetical protein GXO21_01970 [Aquificae bacterium]|nr:hypothetical protein [Aquificota bacterium]
MDEILIKKRQYYFGFLFFSFVYFGLAILLLDKTQPFSLNIYQQIPMIIGAIIPAILFFLKKLENNLKNYILLLFLGQIPLIIGFVLSIIYKNLLYLIVMFPVFILGYLILLPVERGKYGLSKQNKSMEKRR